jgi:RecB family exonuclease
MTDQLTVTEPTKIPEPNKLALPFDRKFSHSSLSTWRRCRVKYKWSYIDNLMSPSSVGQLRGTVGHESLGLWYNLMSNVKNGELTEEQRDAYVMNKAGEAFAYAELEREQSLEKEWDLMQTILPRYFEWARANDNFEEILAIEQKFELDIDGIPLIGYIDGVVKAKNGIWLLEHKFNKQVSTNHLDLDPQVSIYLLAAYKAGVEARGVIYNIIRVAEGGIAASQPVERRFVYRNLEGLAAKQYEVSIQMKEMKQLHQFPDSIPIYRSETNNCSWDCQFFDACLQINDCGSAESVLKRYKTRPPEDPSKKEEKE